MLSSGGAVPTPSSVATKPTLCRYFAKGGACYYGNECQFIHASTTDSPDHNLHTDALDNQPKTVTLDSEGLEVSSNLNNDYYSNAAPINGLPSSSKLHMFLNNPNSMSNDLIAPSSVGVDNTLHHSSSSPSFLSSGMNQTSAQYSRFNNISPNGSPRVTPSQSPLIQRRNKSPLPNIAVGDPSDESAGHPIHQESVGGTTYYYTPDSLMSSQQDTPIVAQDIARNPVVNNVIVPEFHAYHSNPAHIENLLPKTNGPSYFMPDELRMDILRRQRLMMAQVDPKQYADLPTEVDNYHNLCPLEAPPTNNSTNGKSFGYPTTVYKATNTKTGICYCLRRIHGFRLVSTKWMTIADMWKNLQHSNLIQLREVFTTKAFGGEHSIVFVHDYHPGATTMMDKIFSRQQTTNFPRGGGVYGPEGAPRPFSQSKMHGNQRNGGSSGLLSESLIWDYIIQLTSALRAIHAAGLACRTLDPSKILITSKSRLRLNCCGIFDILTFDHMQPNSMPALVQGYQQEDLHSLGKVIVALVCNSISGVRDNPKISVESIARNYSNDLQNVILYLLPNNRMKSINEIMPLIGARFYAQLDAVQIRNDIIENELAKEVHSGRLYRLITKICMITERPDFNMDHSWSETGDRYMLKLFRDYVFHLMTDEGAPWIDMGHVLQCLNKLDAGVEEKLCLSSRDGQNVLVASYAELKRCFETSFNELINSTVQIPKPS